MGEKLRDTFGRSFPYIRLSITDVCNFKCGYCLPNGYFKPNNHPGFLNISEIENLVNGLSDLGVSKITYICDGQSNVRKCAPKCISKFFPHGFKVLFLDNNLKPFLSTIIS